MKEIKSEKIPTEQLLLTIGQVAEFLQISPANLTRKRKAWEKSLPPLRLSSNIVRYRRSDVLKFLEQGHVNGNG